jgi:hypothetical protein
MLLFMNVRHYFYDDDSLIYPNDTTKLLLKFGVMDAYLFVDATLNGYFTRLVCNVSSFFGVIVLVFSFIWDLGEILLCRKTETEGTCFMIVNLNLCLNFVADVLLQFAQYRAECIISETEAHEDNDVPNWIFSYMEMHVIVHEVQQEVIVGNLFLGLIRLRNLFQHQHQEQRAQRDEESGNPLH